MNRPTPNPGAAKRLKAVRIVAGYDTARGAALALGVPVSTYAQHEKTGLYWRRAEAYSKFFGSGPGWLLYGDGA